MLLRLQNFIVHGAFRHSDLYISSFYGSVSILLVHLNIDKPHFLVCIVKLHELLLTLGHSSMKDKRTAILVDEISCSCKEANYFTADDGNSIQCIFYGMEWTAFTSHFYPKHITICRLGLEKTQSSHSFEWSQSLRAEGMETQWGSSKKKK